MPPVPGEPQFAGPDLPALYDSRALRRLDLSLAAEHSNFLRLDPVEHGNRDDSRPPWHEARLHEQSLASFTDDLRGSRFYSECVE